MQNTTDSMSIADLLGPWVDPDWDSGLIDRCRHAWSKPLRDLSNEELATLLRQRVAVEHILPIAKKRVEDNADDDTEMYDGELKAAIEHSSKNI
jgi:CDI immunity proteins